MTQDLPITSAIYQPQPLITYLINQSHLMHTSTSAHICTYRHSPFGTFPARLAIQFRPAPSSARPACNLRYLFRLTSIGHLHCLAIPVAPSLLETCNILYLPLYLKPLLLCFISVVTTLVFLLLYKACTLCHIPFSLFN